VLLDGNHDRGDEFFNAVKHASADALVGEISKETFHDVEPGSAGRCEVHVEARMALQPALHSGVLVRRVVVSNEVEARLQLAHFPFVKTFEQFDFGFQLSLDDRQTRELPQTWCSEANV
jgi:hypothetical protein